MSTIALKHHYIVTIDDIDQARVTAVKCTNEQSRSKVALVAKRCDELLGKNGILKVSSNGTTITMLHKAHFTGMHKKGYDKTTISFPKKYVEQDSTVGSIIDAISKEAGFKDKSDVMVRAKILVTTLLHIHSKFSSGNLNSLKKPISIII